MGHTLAQSVSSTDEQHPLSMESTSVSGTLFSLSKITGVTPSRCTIKEPSTTRGPRLGSKNDMSSCPYQGSKSLGSMTPPRGRLHDALGQAFCFPRSGMIVDVAQRVC